MTDQELLDLILDNEEWQKFEAKRALAPPSLVLETVVAFANTDGGTIILGLEDKAKALRKDRLLGVSENLSNVSDLLKLIDKEIDPPLRSWGKFEIDITNNQGKPDKLLVITIQKSDDVCSLKRGDTFIRKGNQNVKIGSSEIIRLKYEKGSLRFEDESANIKDFSGIDCELLKKYKHDTESEGTDDWQFLKDNGLAILRNNEYEFTKAGVLLFAKNPSVLLRNKCSVKISHYYGTEPSFSGNPNFVIRPFSIEGSLLTQINDTVNYFRKTVKSSPPKLRNSTFSPSLMIPEWAFQEAITNAVIHRNYSLQDDIQVRFFDDRIEIESPGSFPGHIRVRNIRNERFARNPIILRTLNRFEKAPNLDIGEGVDRMFKVMKDKNLYEPLYFPPTIKPNSVLLILFNIHRVEYWDTVNNYLETNYRIDNVTARNITGVNDVLKMSRLLSSWVKKGFLERLNSGYKGKTYYRKLGTDVQSVPLSKGVENESKI